MQGMWFGRSLIEEMLVSIPHNRKRGPNLTRDKREVCEARRGWRKQGSRSMCGSRGRIQHRPLLSYPTSTATSIPTLVTEEMNGWPIPNINCYSHTHLGHKMNGWHLPNIDCYSHTHLDHRGSSRKACQKHGIALIFSMAFRANQALFFLQIRWFFPKVLHADSGF